jgi:AcrR family transcriptional regulator
MRKEPRQKRSRALVDAIVTGGTRVLGQKGWAGFNTNDIAAVAGVSVGSLYQYFPNKLALIEAIRRRHFADVLTAVAPATANQDLATRVAHFVDGLIAVHDPNPQLHRALLDEAPAAGEESRDGAFRAAYFDACAALLPARPHRAVAAQVLGSAVEGVIHDAARAGTLRSAPLRRELTRLILSYAGVAAAASTESSATRKKTRL